MDGIPDRKMQWSALVVVVALIVAGAIAYVSVRPALVSKPRSAVIRQTTTAKYLTTRKVTVQHVHRHGSKVARVTVYVNGVRYVATPSQHRPK